MAKVVVMADELKVGVTLAIVMVVEVWQKEQADQDRRVYLLLNLSKGHIGTSQAPLHYEKSATTRNLSNS